MKNNIFKIGIFALSAFALTGCGDEFLDKMPDRRAEVDSELKVEKLLVSAYSDRGYQMLAEFMSDNVDDYSESNPNTTRFLEEVYFWKDVTETNNESPENFWQLTYRNIATANLALKSIDDIVAKSGWTQKLREAKAEALLCRAYGHFVLVNMFAQQYNSKTSATDLGITIITEPENELNPKYERQTVKECYEAIEKDIVEALPEVGSYYTIPKYHFNPLAAYAFACRFYLYYENWDKAIEYADKVLGASPKTMLRDYSIVGAESSCTPAAEKYVDASANCNLLLQTSMSFMGTAMSNYTRYKRFAHTQYLAANETAIAPQPWGTVKSTDYYAPLKNYSGSTYNYSIFWRVPYEMEYTDPVAGNGYHRTVFPLFTADECLLNRAEAYILKKDYAKACADLNLWIHNIIKTGASDINPDSVQTFYKKIPYAYDNVDGEIVSSPKKRLNPKFEIDSVGSVQESMLQALLNARRIEQLQIGMRWFDIKRYGIRIPRRSYNAAGAPEKYTDWLEVDDPRRAMQIPLKVRDAGYTANPRVSLTTPTSIEMADLNQDEDVE
ncbi:MAG: RagB/SusD family nutrient uptake outer membrane protein [Bacteroidaceae bacterium]|nr:RagB/SusD family nutrient uptake outer membrane protein [Bacteroidaceae bacterium]